MLDIETLGIDPGAIVLSVAAQKFDIETGKISKTFYEKISIEDSIKNHKLEMDRDTFIWWIKENPQLFVNQASGDLHLKSVLAMFAAWLAENDEEYFIWGNSNRFDLGHLSFLYSNIMGGKHPWDFRNERDLRTLISFYPEVKEEIKFEGTKHSPLDDCGHQIKQAVAVWNKLKKNA